MKKAILTFGLFSMMMILTSFTTPGEIGGTQGAPRGDRPYTIRGFEIGGTQGAPRDRGRNGVLVTLRTMEVEGTQGAPRD